MFNNQKIDKLYELMSYLSDIRQVGTTEMLVYIKKYINPNISLIVRDNNECKRLKAGYGIDSINMNNTDALRGRTSPVLIDKDVVVLIMSSLFNEIYKLNNNNEMLTKEFEEEIEKKDNEIFYLELENSSLRREINSINNDKDINVNINIKFDDIREV